MGPAMKSESWWGRTEIWMQLQRRGHMRAVMASSTYVSSVFPRDTSSTFSSTSSDRNTSSRFSTLSVRKSSRSGTSRYCG